MAKMQTDLGIVEGDTKVIYDGVAKMELEFVGNASKQYLVFLLEGENRLPTESNLRYIDQVTGSATTKFIIYPDTVENAGTYTIYVSSTDDIYTKVGKFEVVASWKEAGASATGNVDYSKNSYYIKVTATGGGTIAPDGGVDSMYEVDQYDDVKFEFDADSGYEIADVIVNGNSVGICDEYTFENIVTTMQYLEVVFEKSSSSASSGEDESTSTSTSNIPFSDVSENDKYYEGISYVYENGIMAGISSDEFGSDVSITRGMIAAILYRINGSEPVEGDMPFGDVPGDQYYLEAVRWGKMVGVIAGVSATEFAPDTPITNEQFVVFLFRYAKIMGVDMIIDAGADLSGYADADEITDYAYMAMIWAVEKGIIGEDDLLAPTAEALRGDVANALMIFMKMM